MIQIRNLTKVYLEGETQRTVLKEVSVRVKEGEILILLGRSGSGKSTLLNLISAIDSPTSGNILIDGQDLDQMTEHERTLIRRQSMGFIFQFFNLIPTLTVFENILLPLELNGKTGKDAEQSAHGLLEEVGLSDRKGSFPDLLSGGEQQRVAIARALIHDPPIILADEPTGNLDYETGSQVIDLLRDLVRKKGKTMVMATHSQEIMGLADRVFTVRGGELVQVDT